MGKYEDILGKILETLVEIRDLLLGVDHEAEPD